MKKKLAKKELRKKGDLMITVAASIKKDLLLPVFLWVEHVVAVQSGGKFEASGFISNIVYRLQLEYMCLPLTAKLHGTHGRCCGLLH